MTTSAARGIVRGRTIELAEDAPEMAEGTEVIVLPWGTTLSGQEIVAALDLVPPATAEDGAELERTIAEGWQPMSQGWPFADLEEEAR